MDFSLIPKYAPRSPLGAAEVADGERKPREVAPILLNTFQLSLAQ